MSAGSYLTPGVAAKLRELGRGVEFVGRPLASGNGTATADDEFVMPTTPAEFEDFLNDKRKVASLFASADKQRFPNWVQAYTQTVLDRDVSIATQVREQTEQVVRNWLKENVDLHGEAGLSPISLDFSNVQGLDLSTPERRFNAKAGLDNPRAMGAVLNQEFQGPHAAGEFFQLIWHLRQRDAQAQAKYHKVRNAFSSDTPSEGGFLIPENLRSELLRVSLETSIVRPRARVIPMETLRVPFPAIDSTTNSTSVYGGIVCFWTEEGATLTDSSASFKRIVLDAKKLTAYTQIPNELISDSVISFQAFIDQIFPEALGFYEDIAFLKGTGVGEPLGALSSDNVATIVVAAEAGQPSASIVWENIVKMFARMLPSSLGRAVWIASIDTFPELATMALSVGTGGSAIWLNNGVAGPPMTILGRPVVFTEKAPGVLGQQGDIAFVDFGFYLIGDRQAMSAMSSPHFRFQTDETAYRIIERVDGRPWLQSPITPQNAGPTLSPFVQLAARP